MAECSRKEMSAAQARQKSLKYLPEGESAKSADEIVAYLKGEKYVDDARFAKAYTRDKLRFSKWGPEKILRGLLEAGVEKSLAGDTVASEADLALSVLRDLLSRKRAELEKKTKAKVAEGNRQAEKLEEQLSILEERLAGERDEAERKDLFKQRASLQRKVYSLRMKARMSSQVIRSSLVAFARGRGFTSGQIKDCI